MYVARLIGTNIEVKSEDMLEAYYAVTEFAPIGARVSMKYIPKN